MAGKPKTIELDVNGVRYEIDDDDPSGRDVRAAAGLNPASSFVLIHVRDRGSTSVGLDVFRLAKVTPFSGISASKNDPLSLRL